MANVQETHESNPQMEVAAPADALETIFTYHAPTGDQPEKYKAIRMAGMMFARVVHESCEGGPSRTTAINKIREAVMWANASIATKNAQYR